MLFSLGRCLVSIWQRKAHLSVARYPPLRPGRAKQANGPLQFRVRDPEVLEEEIRDRHEGGREPYKAGYKDGSAPRV